MSTAKKKAEGAAPVAQKGLGDDFVQDLIKDLNREHQTRVAWNLGTDMSPTHVKRWVSTGSVQLDYAVANKKGGGLPEGRIIEIYGQPSIGKSHIAAQICRACQRMGGIAVYIDTENAVNPENLRALGVDVSKRFIYVETGCVEDTFQVMDSIITKTKAANKDVPVVIIWDSVAATPAKAELEAEYTQESIGLQARQLSKGFRKITQLIGNQNITLVCLNQIRTKIGVMFGDPMCVDPFTTKVKIRCKYLYEELSFAELAQRFGISDFNQPTVMDVSEHGFEILSVNDEGKEIYAPLTHYVVKENVAQHYRLGDLKGTSTHRVKHGQAWVMLKDHPDAVAVDESMKVVDVTVEGTECYLANGQINHNTTPGGLSLPFHASTRISLTGGTRIKNKNDELIGINVIASVVKNKVAAPFRKIHFQIHFGKGIVEHEELFDVLREYCDKNKIEKNGKLLSISGTGGWKELTVADAKTGEVLLEKKFYKPDFIDVMRDPKFKEVVADIIDAALVKTPEQAKTDQYDTDIDENAYVGIETPVVATE